MAASQWQLAQNLITKLIHVVLGHGGEQLARFLSRSPMLCASAEDDAASATMMVTAASARRCCIVDSPDYALPAPEAFWDV